MARQVRSRRTPPAASVSRTDDAGPPGKVRYAVIGLGHGLGMPIVAEGVETEAQRLFLARESCDEIQGYLVGRPQPISMYAAMVGRRPTHEPRLALVS